jgi:hypothetical protein
LLHHQIYIVHHRFLARSEARRKSIAVLPPDAARKALLEAKAHGAGHEGPLKSENISRMWARGCCAERPLVLFKSMSADTDPMR